MMPTKSWRLVGKNVLCRWKHTWRLIRGKKKRWTKVGEGKEQENFKIVGR
jgi:hypothetical protein